MKINVWVNLLKALFRGKELDSAVEWKVRGAATSAVTAILAAFVGAAVSMGWIPQDLITTESLATLSAAVVTVVNLVLSFLQIATSKKVGIPPRAEKQNNFKPE